MDPRDNNHYRTFGLDSDCSAEDVRSAYRILAKQHHPDLNGNSPEARAFIQELNAAYEVLSNPERRRNYDRLQRASRQSVSASGTGRIERNISQEVHVKIEHFFHGTTMDIQVRDPANEGGTETYELSIEPMTAPGSRIRVARSQNSDGGFVILKLKARPGFQFRTRGSDLKCDLNISSELASKGGSQSIKSVLGGLLEVAIPRGVARGEIIRIPEEGLPKARGGRGDLLVRITYRPQVTVSRSRQE